jgi:hypothetical protein
MNIWVFYYAMLSAMLFSVLKKTITRTISTAGTFLARCEIQGDSHKQLILLSLWLNLFYGIKIA